MALGIVSHPEKTQFVPCIVKVWGMRRRAGVHPPDLGAQPVLPQPLSNLLIFCHIKDFFPVFFNIIISDSLQRINRVSQYAHWHIDRLCCAVHGDPSVIEQPSIRSELVRNHAAGELGGLTGRLEPTSAGLRGGRPNLLTSSFDQSTRQHEG